MTTLHGQEALAQRHEEPLLRVLGASKTYTLANGRNAQALAPVTVDLKRGDFTSLLGPSGCGKTTLLKMAAGLVGLSGGSIARADGTPLRHGSYGFVFQSPALLPWRTVFDNVLLPAVVLGLPMEQARRRARELLAMVGLEHAAGKRPRELSGGMQQRASIARALLHDPQLLFMDEPFGALDAMTREDLNLALHRIHLEQRKTIVFVTHDIDEAVLLSDRILVMSAGPGRVIADLDVPLPKPRTLALKKQPAFHRTAEHIRALLHRDEHLEAA